MTDDTQGERIAFRSTKGEGDFAKPRWTELAVYRRPNSKVPGGHDFVAETVGCSSVDGEQDRRRWLQSPSLERALQHFVDARGGVSAPARIVMDQARVWAERQGTIESLGEETVGGTYSEAQRDEAIDALYSITDPDEPFPNHRVAEAVDAIAAALGLTRAVAHG